MNTTTNKPLVVAFVVVVVLFVFFGFWGMTGGMMHDDGMDGSGSMGVRSWIWTPTLLTLVFGVVLGWFIFKKKE